MTRQRGAIQAKDGEPVRIRILDYLGGGKLVVDLKGERVVANTALPLEKNQEIDVIVKNLGDKIILQLASDSGQSINLSPVSSMKLPVGDIIQQLIGFLENAEIEISASLNDKLKELFQDVRKLIKNIPVDVTKADLPEQIKNAIKAFGHDYERKLAEAFASGRFSPEQLGSQLKAKLMRLSSLLGEDTPHSRLLNGIENMLKNLEFQQLRTASQIDKLQHFYFQIPVVMHDRMITAELEFFRPKKNSGDDDFSITLNFDLQRLGHMEFAMTVMDKRINCRIKADEYETYLLARQQTETLEGRLTALGYKVDGIQCTLETPESHTAQNPMDMDDIDITV